MSRQAAATNRLPNQGQQEGRLAQVQAGAVQNAQLGAASSADFLASAGAADTRRQQGEQQLGVQGLAYNDKSRQQLRTDLTTQSNRQQHDLDVYNNTKAALTQSSATNLNNAIGTGAAYAASAYNMGAPGSQNTPPAGMGVGLGSPSYLNPNFGPDGGVGGMGVGRAGYYNMGGYGRRSTRYNNGINFGR